MSNKKNRNITCVYMRNKRKYDEESMTKKDDWNKHIKRK